MAFVTERPPIFALHAHVCLRGMLLPQTRSEAGNCVFSKQNRTICVNTFRCKFSKGDENKISVHRLNRPNCALCMNFIGGQGWYTGHYPLVKHGRGYILQPPSRNLHIWLSKQMPSIPEAVRAEAFSVLRCYAGPAEGPGKILKYRSNLRLYPVNFNNKLCILIFIILSIWPNFFDPLYYGKLFGPPFGNSKLFWPPSILPNPPPRYLWTLHK